MATTFSFGPAGTYSLFHAGVAYYLRSHFPVDRERSTAYVISGGALGLAVLTHDSPAEIQAAAERAAEIMGKLKGFWNPFAQMSRLTRAALEAYFPPDAHLTLGSRVQIGMTRFPFGQRHTENGPFTTREEFFDALLTSSYIPGFFLFRPARKYRGLIDGGFSHNECLDWEKSLVVSVGRTPTADIYHDEGKFHIQLLTAAEYMQTFWWGVAAAKRAHEQIRAKL